MPKRTGELPRLHPTRHPGSESRLTISCPRMAARYCGSHPALLRRSLLECLSARSPDEVESEVAHDGHVVRAVAFSEAGLILVEDDVEGPVESIFDQPVAAHRMAARSAARSVEAMKYLASKGLLSFSPVRDRTRTMVMMATP